MKLVCGYGVEFNVTSEVDLHLSTNQLDLMTKKVKEAIRSFSSNTDTGEERAEEKDSVEDSGMGSDISNVTFNKSVAQNKGKGQRKESATLTPFDLLLTAGRISFTVYTHEITEKEIVINHHKHMPQKKPFRKSKQDLEWKVVTDSEGDANRERGQPEFASGLRDPYLLHMYDLDARLEETRIEAGSVCIRPFLFVYISQPHMVVALQPQHQKFEMSCYDVLMKGADSQPLVQGWLSSIHLVMCQSLCNLIFMIRSEYCCSGFQSYFFTSTFSLMTLTNKQNTCYEIIHYHNHQMLIV